MNEQEKTITAAEQKTDDKYVEMAKQFKELMNGGKTLEEALRQIVPETKTTSRPAIADRVAWIAELTSIAELRHAIKIAFAKKSKSKGKDSEDKYQSEIEAGRKRLNELLAQVNTAADPIAKAIELGEEESGVVQKILEFLEKDIDTRLDQVKDKLKLTNKDLKDKVNASDAGTPAVVLDRLTALGKKYIELYNGRASKGDQRVVTINKRLNYLDVAEKTPAPKPEQKPDPKPEVKEDPKPEQKPDTKPEQKQAPKQDQKPNQKGQNK